MVITILIIYLLLGVLSTYLIRKHYGTKTEILLLLFLTLVWPLAAIFYWGGQIKI